MTPKTYQGVAELYRFVGSTSLADETAEDMDPNRNLRQFIKLLGNNQT